MAKHSDYVSFLDSLAKGAGKILRELYGTGVGVRHKGEIDLVTEADTRSEEYLLKRIEKEDPQAKVLSEEFHSAYEEAKHGDVGPDLGDCWIIDPLDGTTNFAHGFPWFAVSLCRYEAGRPAAGAVYLPMQDELFLAEAGKGAFLNGAPIKVSKGNSLQNALFATGFPYDIHQAPTLVMEALKAMITRVQGVRRAGAAAIDMAYVACGRFDGFWEQKLKPWDTAAGMLICEEAGGRVSTFSLKSYNPFVPEILATNGKVHEAAAQILKDYSILEQEKALRPKPRNPVPTVDIIIRIGSEENIVLIERKNPPHGWALPGGFVDYGESLEEAAKREAFEETGLRVQLKGQFRTYSDPTRDLRLHTISTVFIADAEGEPKGGDDAKNARIFNIKELPSPLCFDHDKILKDYKESIC